MFKAAESMLADGDLGGNDSPRGVAATSAHSATGRPGSHQKPVTVLYVDHTAALSGGEFALLRLLEALDPEFVNPIVLLAAHGPLEEKLHAIGVTTEVLPLGDKVRNIRKDTLGLGALRHLGDLFATFFYGLRVGWYARKHRVHIIHANSLKSDIYGGIAGLVARVPVIWHVRDHINPSYLPPVAVAVFRFLANAVPSFVVANSQSTLSELRLDREHRTAIVPSGLQLRSRVVHDGLNTVDPAEGDVTIEAAEAADRRAIIFPKPDGTPVRIGLVGRIARWKGQHIFIEAASRVLAAGSKAEFYIVGSAMFGEEAYHQEIRDLVAKHELESAVHFLGFKDNAHEIYHHLDMVVHASTTPEPFGQVVIEGMAEGLPVIATDGGGVREIVNHRQNGLLVPMGDAPAMAEAILELLRDPALAQQLGSVGYRWVRRHFTAAQSARKIERVYRSILAS